MKRLRLVLAATAIVSGLWAVAPGSAQACPDGGCAPCYVRPPAVDVEGGTITMPPQLVECYY
jgi:hypothetical protein